MVLSTLHHLPLHMFDFSVVTQREHHHANMLTPKGGEGEGKGPSHGRKGPHGA